MVGCEQWPAQSNPSDCEQHLDYDGAEKVHHLLTRYVLQMCIKRAGCKASYIASDMSLMTEGHTSQVKLHSGCSNTAPTKYCAAVCFLKGQAVSIKTEK